MDIKRREILAMIPMAMTTSLANAVERTAPELTIIDNFADPSMPTSVPGTWSGFTDRVMGGVSDATFTEDVIGGRTCIRLQGTVTRDQGGGFVQMARNFGSYREVFNAIPYQGLELTVFGNNEVYNIHLRTSDVRWYDQSYRTSFFAEPQWQTFRFPWSTFIPNSIDKPLNLNGIQRIGLLGWMREFQADLALSKIGFYS